MRPLSRTRRFEGRACDPGRWRRAIALLAALNVVSMAVAQAGAGLGEGGYAYVTEADGLRLDLRYASPRNVAGRAVEDDAGGFYLHPIAASKLRKAVSALRRLRPTCRLVVFDGLRTGAAQHALWDSVKGTDKQRYVANPTVGSIHSYGFAVDLSIADGAGAELDMGTPFDDFTPLAEPRLEAKNLADGRLTPAQVGNRRLLRRVMIQAGFQPLAIEWWHFDALPPATVRARYPIVP